MTTKSTKQLRTALDAAILGYIRVFEHKHGIDCDDIESSDSLGILCFGDHYFNFDDIVYDVDNKLPVRLIFQWKDDGIQAHFNGSEQNINLRSYAAGLRFDGVTE